MKIRTSLALCFFSIQSVFAQDVIDTTIVSTAKVPQNIKHVGSSVTILDRQNLEQRGDRNLADALKRVPAVSLSRNGGAGSITNIRLRGTDAEDVLILIDNINVTDSSSPNNRFDFSTIQTHDIERVEIIKGNQSALYGSQAIGGVINIITRKADTEGTNGEIFAEGGSYGAASGGISIFHKNKDISASLNASHFRDDGFSRSKAGKERDGSEISNISSSFGFTPNENMKFGVSIQNRVSNVEYDPSSTTDGDSDYDKDFFTGNINGEILSFDKKLRNTITLGGTQIDRNENTIFGNTYESQRRFANYQGDLYVFERDVISLGAEYEYEEASSGSGSTFDENRERNSLYGQYIFGLSDNITFTFGGRIDDYDTYGTNETFRGSLAYNIPQSGTTIRASYGTGFKAPTVNQLFDTSFGSNNPNLQPEKSKGFDVGIEHTFPGNYTTIGLTYFNNDIDNLINYDSGTFRYENVDKAEIRGFETFINIDPSEYVSLFANYTLTDAKDVSTGREIARRPRHTASVGVDVFPTDSIHFGLLGRFTGKEYNNNFSTAQTSSNFIVDANISYEVNNNFEIYGRVDNIFDRDYSETLGYNTSGIVAFGGVKIGF